MSALPNVLRFRAESEPVSLVDKYRPRTIGDFAGISKVKETMARFVESPRKSAWTFYGNSGTGKTSMAHLVAEQIDAELIFVPSQECTADRLRWVVGMCQSRPMTGQRFTLVLVDEADSMSKAARDFLLSTLDNLPPDVIFIFTCNRIDSFEDRFLSGPAYSSSGITRFRRKPWNCSPEFGKLRRRGRSHPTWQPSSKRKKGTYELA